MPRRLNKAWLNNNQFTERIELRLDWSDDYHLLVAIEPPFGPDEVIDALLLAARRISVDSRGANRRKGERDA